MISRPTHSICIVTSTTLITITTTTVLLSLHYHYNYNYCSTPATTSITNTSITITTITVTTITTTTTTTTTTNPTTTIQERFVKVEGKYLNYYKKKNDDKSLGTASMETADFVRPFDATAECNIFEIQDENRVFVFQTPSHNDMLKWVNSINKVITAYKEQKRASDEAKLASQTPINVRIYDEIGEIEFLAKIEIELSELYPTIEMEELTLKEHISCAGIVVQYLLDFVTEIQCFSSDKGKR